MVVASGIPRRIRDVILVARVNDQELGLVRLSDGGWGISCNHEIVHEHWWPESQLEECVETFIRQADLARPSEASE